MDTNTSRGSDPFITDSGYNNFSTSSDIHSTGYTGSLDGASGRDSWKTMAENLYSDMLLLWDRQNMLVRTEMNEKLTEIKAASVSIGAGGVLLFVGAFAAVATAIICLNLIMPLWASAVLVTAVILIAGAIMVVGGKKKIVAGNLKPARSIETFGEISTTLKERLYEFKNKH